MILVTGGSGFIGGAIVRKLVAAGERVRCMTRSPDRARLKLGDLNVEFSEGDVTDPVKVTAAMWECDTIVNCVQFPNFPVENKRRGYTFERIDNQGTRTQVRGAKEVGAKRFIYLSGAGVGPNATRAWFQAKWGAESAVRGSGLAWTIFRPSWVYGPGDRSLNRFVGLARRLPFVPMFGDGKQRIQPVFVDDVATCVAASVRMEAAYNKVFEIGGPQVLTMNQIMETVFQVLGKKRMLLHTPIILPKLMAFPMEFLPSPPLSRDAIDFITMEGVVDNKPLLQTFKIQLTPLRQGLATYLRR